MGPADKSLLKSRTFWFTLVTGLIAALVPVLPVLSAVKDFMANNSVLLASIWSFAGFALRLVTKDKVVLVD